MHRTVVIHKGKNKQKKELITFKNIPYVYSFFKTRGFITNQDKPVKYLNLIMLRHNLKKKIEEAQYNNDTEELDILKPAYEELAEVLARHISKHENLTVTII